MPLGTFNLASRYMGGGGAGAVIPVAKRIQATVTGTRSSTTTGFIGTAINQSSSGTYFNIVLGSGYKIGGGSPGTLEFYMKFASLSAQQSVFTRSNTNEMSFMSNTGNGPRLRLAQNTSVGEYWEAALSTNTWYHFAITTSGNNTWKLWRDGSLMTTFTYSGNITSYSFSTNSAGAAQYDEIRFSKVERYTATFTRPSSAFTNDSNTLALFHCESTTETDDGTGANGWLRAPSTASYISLTSVSGNFGNSLSHSGTTNTPTFSINTPTSLSGAITLEFWMKPPSPASNTLVHSFGNNVRIQWGTDGYRFWTSGASSYKGATSGLNSGSWNYVVLQSDGTNLHRWINGVWKGTYTSYNLNGNEYTFGRNLDTYTFGSDFTGPVYYFDEVRISNIQRYTTGANISVPTAPFVNDSNTVALFHCNSTTDTDDTSEA